MKNKYVLSRSQEVEFVKKNLEEFLDNSMILSRYEKDDPDYRQAKDNFIAAYDFILNHPEVENDYRCLINIHQMLMHNLEDSVLSQLNDEQIERIKEMVNQPAKANVEIAIDVMLYILDKRIFTDGDVRAALMFANKIMVDCGCGFITIAPKDRDTYREKLHKFRDEKDPEIKEWIYKYCVKGVKTDSQY